MSSIYVSEPATRGRAVLYTTYGPIEVEFWPKEAPKAVRNFIQHAATGYFDGCVFHRVVKGTFIQTGDPSGTGTGGESIYGSPFPDEFHPRWVMFERFRAFVPYRATSVF
jgi:peptidyl-prolyl cis-trans isomerase SDCCAG10